MRVIKLSCLCLLALTGCAQNSGVVKYQSDIYMVSRQAATGFSGAGTLKSEVLKEANTYCDKQGKDVDVVEEIDAEPPYVFGNFPRSEIRFRCVDRSSNDS